MRASSLWDRWPWDSPIRWLVFWGVQIPFAVVGALVWRSSVLEGVMLILVGPILGLVNLVMYGAIDRRVKTLQASWQPVSSEPEVCVVFKGGVQAPGLVAFVDGRVMLRTFFGGTVSVSLEQIAAVRETKWFNGTFLIGKTGFRLTVPGQGRLGFAVPSSTAQQWRERLSLG